ncbi:acyl-[acyl-carrier-protein] thioesterase [Candidatus Stoquefichus massiliensis]|uniref:acyl-[acyl-carrier-protein] thioesterase n=1 Tax=Candidatus Stoquefichus massiliensis TaxID=1470350 RepID=UPI000483D0EB|nr:acyl-ACP thioesterase domain-containing protein [Candidatus Stoquefichus massiliensis]
MKNLRTYETKQIEICEVDYMGQYQLCHLLNRFSEIATINAKELGMWNEEMMKQYGWVVAKQSLHLDEPIYYKDMIELSTIINNGSFVAFPRYYFIKKNKKEIGHCSSIWTLINIQKRRIVSPKKIGIMMPEVLHDIYLDEPQSININIPMDYKTTRQVLYSDVDTNQHMNNTRYVQWALDIIDYQIHKDFFISDLNIQYKKEIRPLENVELYLGQDKTRYIVEGRGNQGIIYFTIEIYFNKR